MSNILNKLYTTYNAYKDSTTNTNKEQPHFSISCNNIDPIHGIQIDYEYRDDFVLYLRQNGYVGIDDETILRNFFLKMYAEMHEKLKANGALPNYGDFE
jgi:hypothetical protein